MLGAVVGSTFELWPYINIGLGHMVSDRRGCSMNLTVLGFWVLGMGVEVVLFRAC